MDGLVRIYATGDHVQGELMKARLEAEEVEVLLKGGGEGPYRVGPTYLFVRAEDEARAKAVVDAMESGAFALADDDVLSSADDA
jgi:hypothetical protein